MASDQSDAGAGRTALRFTAQSRTWALAALVLVLLAWCAHWIYLRWSHVYLDDAPIDGEVITVSSRVAGWIVDLPVVEGDRMKAGQLLVQIDDRDNKLQLEVLEARLKATESQSAAMRVHACQVDQETLGKYEGEVSRLAGAEAEAASLAAQLKQAAED